MKEFEIEIKKWINGSGWSYNSTIEFAELPENVNVKDFVDEYASNYIDDMRIDDFIDGDYVISASDENGNKTESEWLSSFLDD